ncbi:hypothetical protein Tco_0371397, partial [Tanacetum coccineum]
VASQVDVNNDLSKLITTHYLPKEIDHAIVKPHHVSTSSESRNSSKNMPRFSSNDMVHNHYLEEAKKKTHDQGRILKTVGLRWVPTRKIFTSSTTTVYNEPTNGSNKDITNQYECEQTLDVSASTLDSSAGTSINVQEEQNLNLSKLRISTPSNLKKERIKACIKENVISGRPRLHRIALIQEIYDRQKSQGIQSLLTS